MISGGVLIVIVDTWEIGVRIGSAYLHGESLTLEYDAGTIEVTGDDLLDAWAGLQANSDPFTIVEG